LTKMIGGGIIKYHFERMWVWMEKIVILLLVVGIIAGLIGMAMPVKKQKANKHINAGHDNAEDDDDDDDTQIEALQGNISQSDSMFENPGKKIKNIAKTFCGLSIAVFVLIGFAMLISGANMKNGGIMVVSGLAVAAFGSFISWLGALMIYAQGTLVENSCIQAENSRICAEILMKQASKQEEAE